MDSPFDSPRQDHDPQATTRADSATGSPKMNDPPPTSSSTNPASPSPNATIPDQATAMAKPSNGNPNAKSHQHVDDSDFAPVPGVVPHPETDAILRQVHYYFSDENLPQDAHLLSLTGEFGDGYVSLNEILSFKKMRQFKPPSRVKASLHQSTELLIWRNKLIRRKKPLTVPLKTEKPKPDLEQEQKQALADKPWMTKNMLKPTGFEVNYAEQPLKPDEAQAESLLFDPEESFPIRIEHAVALYESKRKMHQKTLHIFTKFLTYGGFKTGPNQFGGGLGPKELEDYDKHDIALMKSQFSISDIVLDGLEPNEGTPSWIVDFETYAKAYLSCEFMDVNWRNIEEVEETANLMRNFYNYLLYHDVCPEYAEQILKAKVVCDLAEEEFPKLAKFDEGLKGYGFNAACSTLHDGYHKDCRPWDPSAEEAASQEFMSDEEARRVFFSGALAHCSQDEFRTITTAIIANATVPVISSEDMGLEVISVECASDSVENKYGSSSELPHIKPTGKLHCRRWEVPTDKPQDLPEEAYKQQKARLREKHVFLLEEETLRYCMPGMKVHAIVKQLETGLKWIDSFYYVYPTFYTWTLNERLKGYKPPGPPKTWMKRRWAQSDGNEVAKTEEGVEADAFDDSDAE